MLDRFGGGGQFFFRSNGSLSDPTAIQWGGLPTFLGPERAVQPHDLRHIKIPFHTKFEVPAQMQPRGLKIRGFLFLRISNFPPGNIQLCLHEKLALFSNQARSTQWLWRRRCIFFEWMNGHWNIYCYIFWGGSVE